MYELLNHAIYSTDLCIEFTPTEISNITTKQGFHNLLLSKIPTTDTSILDSASTAFTKTSYGIGLRYSNNRGFYPIIKFKNVQVPKSISLKGTYTQVSGKSMFFGISVQKITDNSYFRILIINDGAAELIANPVDGVFINNGATHFVNQKLTDTLDLTTYMSNQSNFGSFIGNEQYCNICIESCATYYYSTGVSVSSYPFYMNGFKFTY